MAEGGIFAWKRQKVNQRGPTADYACLKLSLPLPPKGTVWQHNQDTKEWKIVVSESTTVVPPTTTSTVTDPERPLRPHHDNVSPPPPSVPGLPDGAVKNVDYVEHVVLPTDTFPGLCLQYKITATRLRQVNLFSGTNLRLAPPRLIVPVRPDLLRAGKIRRQDEDSEEYKTVLFLSELPTLRQSEAKYYLELANYDVAQAVDDARADLTWERRNADAERRIVQEAVSDPTTDDMTLFADQGIPVDEGRPVADVEMVPLIS